MSLSATFVTGSRAGTVFALEPGREVGFGRSHASAVRLEEGDVSGHHVLLLCGPEDRVSMKVLSQHLTTLNGRQVAPGSEVALAVGDEVGMGCVVRFKLTGEGAGGTGPTPVAVPQLEEDDEIETELMRTRNGSDEEILAIKRRFRAQAQRKFITSFAPVAVAVAAVVALTVLLVSNDEEFTSWPTDKDGEDLFKYELVEPSIAVCVPDLGEDVTVVETERGKRVTSALGRDRDIPLTVEWEILKDKKFLEVDRLDAFDAYLKLRRQQEQQFAPGSKRAFVFFTTGRGGGVPVSWIDFTRRVGDADRFGYLVYLRRADQVYAITVEVPVEMRWRADEFLRVNLGAFVIYAPRSVPEHWEGASEFRRETTVEQDLAEARVFLSRKASSNWDPAFYRIRSALIKATRDDDEAGAAAAQDLLVRLREEQGNWYNRAKLAYRKAELAGREGDIQAIQASGEEAFTPVFMTTDFRYERIKRKEWR